MAYQSWMTRDAYSLLVAPMAAARLTTSSIIWCDNTALTWGFRLRTGLYDKEKCIIARVNNPRNINDLLGKNYGIVRSANE